MSGIKVKQWQKIKFLHYDSIDSYRDDGEINYFEFDNVIGVGIEFRFHQICV